MKRIDVKTTSVDDLVKEFTAVAIEQGQALLMDEVAKFNRLYDEMDIIRNELRSRPGDQRKALLPLLRHNNVQVRLKAAITTLAVTPDASKSVLKDIAESKRYPQAADAGLVLRGLDDGSYQPV
jgi:hypothetical protein